MKTLKCLLVGSVALYQMTGFSAEIDSFTKRNEHLKMENSYTVLNARINMEIENALESANKKSGRGDMKACGKEATDFIVQKVKTRLGNHLVPGNFFNWANDCKVLEKEYVFKTPNEVQCARVNVPDSVYQDFLSLGIFSSFSLSFVSLFKDTTSWMYHINDLVIGLEKFTHFSNKGRQYFRRYYGLHGDTKDLTSEKDRYAYLVAYNEWAEKSVWGTKSTGVGSYGDLAANFSGMRFYNDLTGYGKDIVTGEFPEDPILKCVETTTKSRSGKIKTAAKWVKTRSFELEDYLNPAWDEAYNCTLWKFKEMSDSVYGHVEKQMAIQRKQEGNPDLNLHCPIDLEALQNTKEDFYGKFYRYVVQETGYDYIRGDGFTVPKPDGSYFKGIGDKFINEMNGDVNKLLDEVERLRQIRRKNRR